MTDVADQVAKAVLDGMKRQLSNSYPDWISRGARGEPILDEHSIADRFRKLPDSTQTIISANVLDPQI